MKQTFFTPQRNEEQPGEWQVEVDSYGVTRRYRMIGHCKEYEPTVFIDGLEVPESQVQAYHKARTEAKEKELDRKRKKTIPATVKKCPFKAAKNALDTACLMDCPFYENTGCILSSKNTQDTKDTAGAFCPICAHCVPDCALYCGGCTLPETIKRLKGNR